jgi:hypothetical protein
MVAAHKPLLQTSSTLVRVNEYLENMLATYSHEIAGFGGYNKGSFALNGSIDDCNDWYLNGLGRHIITYSPTTKRIWEGFVNRVDVAYGSVSRTVGPLLDIGNKVQLNYTLIDTDTDIPLHGVEIKTAWFSDADSQAKYGVFEVVLSGSELSATEADQTINGYLTQHAWPPKTRRVSPAQPENPRIRVDLLGYNHWLFYKYNNSTGTGKVNLSTKITDVLTADPNSIIASDYSNIVTNTTQVADYEDANRTAEALIKSLLISSDGSYDRYLFGIYGDRVAFYETVPANNPPTYLHNPSDLTAKITDIDDTEVYPWNVLPGKWLYLTGFDIGRAFPDTTNLFTDDILNYMFIEKAVFTIPNRVVLDGGKITGLNQRLSTAKALSGTEV